MTGYLNTVHQYVHSKNQRGYYKKSPFVWRPVGTISKGYTSKDDLFVVLYNQFGSGRFRVQDTSNSLKGIFKEGVNLNSVLVAKRRSKIPLSKTRKDHMRPNMMRNFGRMVKFSTGY